jgi:hypothetical protein
MTLSVAPPEELAAKAAMHAAAGFRCLKVKLDARMDVLASMRAVRVAAGPDVVLRIDANQAFNAGTASGSSGNWRTPGWRSNSPNSPCRPATGRHWRRSAPPSTPPSWPTKASGPSRTWTGC